MPISAEELAQRGKAGLDFYLKNNPIDQVSMARPFLKELSKKKKTFSGAKQYITEQLRTGYGENGVWFSGSGENALTYNKRASLDQANFPWYQFHDGMGVDEDRLIANGISLSEKGKPSSLTEAEKVQITNLFTEQMEVLRLGAQERFSRDIQLAGGGSPDQIVGLDGLLPLDPTTGVVGGIDRATKKWWRHYADPQLGVTDLLSPMEKAWRACTKRSSGAPNLILAGGDFIDTYRSAALTDGAVGHAVRAIQDSGKGGVDVDMATYGLYYKGVPIQYCPEWDDNFGGADTPAVAWSKRCYFINTNHMTLRPIEGNDFVVRQPPRDKDAYTAYFAILWRGALTMNLPQAHAVLALA